MVTNLSFPAKTVPEFIAYAKANPGKINMGSAGSRTLSAGQSVSRRSEPRQLNFALSLIVFGHHQSCPAICIPLVLPCTHTHALRQADHLDRFGPTSSSPTPRPIAPAAPSVPHFPRFRALALLGRRPQQHMEASSCRRPRNLHNLGHSTLFSMALQIERARAKSRLVISAAKFQ
jgi:Tripartite tricarboxylate transporter family receptor